MPPKWFALLLASIFISMHRATAFGFVFGTSDEEPKKTLPLFLGHRPRIISIFSKPADKDAPVQTGPGILGHVGNVIHGGSIGIEFNPVRGVQGMLEHAKKIIPHGKPVVGQPEHHHTPPPEPHDPHKGGHQDTDEPEKEWMLEKPENPEPEGPSWENIGEDPEDDPSIPYEEIINPRVKPRPKRHYLNSKIYHVPLKFVSNARPFQLRFYDIEKLMGNGKSVNGVL